MAKKFVLSAYLKNAIRRLSYKHPARSAAIAAVRVRAPHDWPNKRVHWVAPCAKCTGIFELKDMQCDHIEPIIPTSGWPHAPNSELYTTDLDSKDMNVLVYRTFVGADQLQIMCKPCHLVKSKAENAERKRSRNERA